MSDAPVLLDDDAMRRFLRDGYILFQPEFPDGFNGQVYERLNKVFEAGNPNNNCLPCTPELQQMLDHPRVHGALASILGPDYYLHLHRHVHDNPPGSKGQGMHKDSLYNSRFAVDDRRRHHRTRWLMLFYYPQDTPPEMGPTAIVPKSQYLNLDAPEGEEEVFLSGKAGTVAIVHYDLLHRGSANRTNRMRYMAKFLFTRMSEPTGPTWDHTDAAWEEAGHPQESIWRHMWDWHRGVADTQEPSDEPVETLAARLGDETEISALTAGYELGLRGEAAVPLLIDALNDANTARNAAYAFNRIGAPAVPALLDAARSGDEKVRARAFDILGDMGRSAADAVSALTDALGDAANDPRRRATEALGTVGQVSANGSTSRSLGERLTSDESGEVRRNASLSLARLGPAAADAVPALAHGLRDPNHYVRGFSVYALKRISTPEALGALVPYLETMRWDWGNN